MNTENARSVSYDVSNGFSKIAYINDKVKTVLSDIFDDYFGENLDTEEAEKNFLSAYEAMQTKLAIALDIVIEAENKIEETIALQDKLHELLPEQAEPTYTTEFMKIYETLPLKYKVEIAKFMFSLIDNNNLKTEE